MSLREQHQPPSLRDTSLPAMQGRYSLLEISPDQITKHNYLHTRSPDAQRTELSLRMSNTIEYFNRLKELGVQMPRTSSDLTVDQLGNLRFTMICERIPAPHNLIQIALSQTLPEKLEILSGMFDLILRVMSSHSSEKPIGLDSGFDNFITYKRVCYNIDLYPPRLGYRVLDNHKFVALPAIDLLVNYPERQNLSPDREMQFQRYYYTSEGMLEHFSTWALATVFTRVPRITPEAVIRHADSNAIIQSLIATLDGRGKSGLSRHLINYLQSEPGKEELSHRMKSITRLLISAREGGLS